MHLSLRRVERCVETFGTTPPKRVSFAGAM
jgi:hypothetical protein